MDIGSGSKPKKGKTSRDPNTPSFRKVWIIMIIIIITIIIIIMKIIMIMIVTIMIIALVRTHPYLVFLWYKGGLAFYVFLLFSQTINIRLKRPKYMRTGSKRTFVDVDEQKQVCVFFVCICVKDNFNVTNLTSPVVLNSFMLSGVRKWKQRYRLYVHVVCWPKKLSIFLFLVIYAFFALKQIRFGKLATLENVVKVCAFEFLGIQEESYEEEIARRNIDVFLVGWASKGHGPHFPLQQDIL